MLSTTDSAKCNTAGGTTRVLYLPDVAESRALTPADFAPHGLELVAAPAGWFPASEDERFPAARAVVGVGVGGNAAIRLALRFPDRFPVAAALDPAFDIFAWHGHGTELDVLYPSAERCRQDSAGLWLEPARLPERLYLACDAGSDWRRGYERVREKFTAYGVPHDAADTVDVAALVAWLVPAAAAAGRRLM